MEINKLICGDSLEVLKIFPDESVDCCITSPPYFGLRDYGTAKWEGDENCNHESDKTFPTSTLQGGKSTQGSAKFYKDICPKCGAKRIDSQIGLESQPEEYVTKLVEVFKEVKRVLKKTGTFWLNLGDSYAGSGRGRDADGTVNPKQSTNKGSVTGRIVNLKSLSKNLIEKGAIGNAWGMGKTAFRV